MQQNKTYKITGLFVIVGILCLFGTIFHYVGKQMFMNQDEMIVLYFDESIQGLSVGSSVVMQGVEIGKVEKIGLIANLNEGTFKTPVFILFSDSKSISYIADEDMSEGEILHNLIEKGLRARLMTSSFLTGQLRIELIMDPSQPAILRDNEKYYEIPTVLSPYERISKDLEEIPLQDSLIRIGNLVAELDDKMPKLLDNFDAISSKVDRMLDKKSGEISKTLNNVNATMEEISKASRSVKNLTDYLERHPEAIIQGKGK